MSDTYPLNLDVTSPAEVERWRPLVNWLLAIPALVWLAILNIGMEVMAILSWFVILFTGRQPEGWGAFILGVIRYQWRVYSYLFAWAQVYPSFSVPSGYPDPSGYPAVLSSTMEGERNRLTVLVRIFMVIPQVVVLYFVGIAAGVVLIIAWFAVLFTGRWPEGMRTFCIGYYRWYLRMEAYLLLVTDIYPPFRLDP